jgi:glucose/arabinose dehydrogenase
MTARRRTVVLGLAVVCVMLALVAGGTADTLRTASGLRLVLVGKFDSPVGVVGAPGDPKRLFVVERPGEIAVVQSGRVLTRPFLDIRKLVNTSYDEQGLLGLAFSPQYATNGLFYVDYTMPNNDIRIAQFSRLAGDPNVAAADSERVVLTIDHHKYQNHNGGDIAFGPDGYLYIGVGDGGSEGDPDNNGQNTDTLLGKMLRIEPKPGGGYKIPPGNPFIGHHNQRAEIWAYGLRNPWRFSFDRKNGALIIGDVGQSAEEEIDYAANGTGAGANYGWSVWEAHRRNRPGTAPHAVFPVLSVPHSKGYCAIIGGYVERDPTVPALNARYLFGDYCRSAIMSVRLSPGHASAPRATGLSVSATSAFGQDDAGHVYIASLNGPVYRVEQH